MNLFLNFTGKVGDEDPSILLDHELDANTVVSLHGLNEVRGINKNSKRYECHFSEIEGNITYKMFLYEHDSEEYPRDQYIKGGDIIKL